ncbi:MAG: alanine--tRNA ligase [Chloroflexota bacterium]
MDQKPSSAEIRQQFLDFFTDKGHTIVPSASLVPYDDPTLLFTNAGMNQFKDVFLNVGTRPYSRAADTQKCMRVSGKHNDLEDVGKSLYHHTFFEMLGNWSFGDYYKKEAIRWAWELLTGVWQLPKQHLYATVFEDDKGDLGCDTEAAAHWLQMTDIAADRVLYFGRKDNFWEMGDTGPCGPCSEIHLDRGPEFCDMSHLPDHVCRVNGDCQRFVELWNLVFIQYNRHADGSLTPLPARHVDTGMGFERIVSVLQGVRSNYDTDLFAPIIRRAQKLLGHTDAQRAANEVAYRVIADHGRAITFLIGDGVLPGNEGRNYTLRMILRRAARFGRTLGFREPFLAQIAQVIIDIMGHFFAELRVRRDFILATVTEEEKRFLRTLDAGLSYLDDLMAKLAAQGSTLIPGKEAFDLWSRDGFPLDLTRDVAQENGFTVDEAGFHQAMARHVAISSAGHKFQEIDARHLARYSELLASLKAGGRLPEAGVDHLYAQGIELEARVAALLQDGVPLDGAAPGDAIEVVLDRTPFYVESGGQVSDTGNITGQGWQVCVTDTRQPTPGLIVHLGQVKAGSPRVGELAWARVDAQRRRDIARNHTATHLLHKALRATLGDHVAQAGSLVAPDRLRFDFTHPAALTPEQLNVIETMVNEAILESYPMQALHMPYQEAVAGGAIALFGEKYGDTVRVMKTGDPEQPYTQELCGGTHVGNTVEIGLLHIVSEGSVGAGVRRIEAVTGRSAQAWVRQRVAELESTAAMLSCRPDEVKERVAALKEIVREQEKSVATLKRQLARQDFESLLAQVEQVAGVPVLAAQVEAAGFETLREMTDWFRDRLGSGVVVLGALLEGRPGFVAAVTPDLVGRGVHAGKLVQATAQIVGGGGGGKPTLAQAGGRDATRLAEALEAVPRLVGQLL